jgi:hypothetical protein
VPGSLRTSAELNEGRPCWSRIVDDSPSGSAWSRRFRAPQPEGTEVPTEGPTGTIRGGRGPPAAHEAGGGCCGCARVT